MEDRAGWVHMHGDSTSHLLILRTEVNVMCILHVCVSRRLEHRGLRYNLQ